MPFSRKDGAKEKSKIAQALSNGDCGGGYGEAVLIICAAIGAMAAEAWPGKSIDRKRFVEFLVNFATVQLNPKTISVPLLIEVISQNNVHLDVHLIEKSFGTFPPSRILVGAEIDHPETAILAVRPSLSLKDIRSCSYANILYKQIRSSFAHEYAPGEKASSLPMTRDYSAGVSYVNRIDPVSSNSRSRRLICFHIPWLAGLLENLGQEADLAATSFPLKTPTKWWIAG